MMRHNLLGRTGLLVSELAFGAGVTGGIMIKGDETTKARALARAVAGGINWIDTAALYGDGASEEAIGRHIGALRPQPHVSTKVRIERDQMNDIPGAIERSLEQSLRRLRLDQRHAVPVAQPAWCSGRRPAGAFAGAGAGSRRRCRHLRPAA